MPSDVAAEVIANTPLSDDYNVLALAAPAIAVAAAAGPVRDGEGGDRPRPAAAPAVLRVRDPSRRERRTDGLLAAEQAHRPVDRACSTRRGPASGSACLGPLGRPFTMVEPPTEAWMVAGGVGLAPFAALAEGLVARGVKHDVVLRRPPRLRAVLSGHVPEPRREAGAGDRRRHRRRPRTDRRAARSRSSRPAAPGDPRDVVRLRPGRACWRRPPHGREMTPGPVRSRSSA